MNYNELLTFGRKGNAKDLTSTGIDFTDDASISWTIQQQCTIEFSLPIPRQDVMLEIDAFPFISVEKVESQQVFVYLNGLFQGFHTFRDRETVKFPIIRSAISSRSTLLSLAIPTAVAPKNLNLGNDLRALGLAFFSMSFMSK